VGKLLYTVELKPSQATVEDVRRLLGLGPDELDENFGVVPIDPHKSLYSILVEHDALERLESTPVPVHGPFLNPRIETFGPPQ
jgi:hypothetical protein